MARKKRVIHNVQIVDIGEKGTAIGKSPDGEVVIIQKDSVPGDVINYLVKRKKKGLKFGVPEEYLTLSPDRVLPFCAHFGVCGGCKWQNLRYDKQVFYKEQKVRETIKRIAKEDPGKVSSILKASRITAYRNKLEYTFSNKRWLSQEEVLSRENFSERPGLGFHIAGLFDKVLDIESCHLQDSFGDQLRNEIRIISLRNNWPFYDIKNNLGFLRNLLLRNTTLDEWMVIFVFGERDMSKINPLFEELIERFPKVKSWNYIINTKSNSSLFDLSVVHVSGNKHIKEKLGETTYFISPKSFFQTNSFQAKVLYDKVLELASLKKTDVVYDLYTGTGSIALYLAKSCKKVVGIEEIPEAIEDASINALNNHIENASFVVGDVKSVLAPSFSDIHGNPDVIITDPPRSGMHKDVISTILSLSAPVLVYISCNPSTQARDISLLKEKYNLIKVVPIDMFPHTSHIESVALLTLK